MFTPSQHSIIISQQIRKHLADHESETPTNPLQQLASDVARHMANHWGTGQQSSAEDVLEQHPELKSHPNAALRIIYEEICLRIESGEELDIASLRQRFPIYAGEIEVLLAGHDLMKSMSGSPQWPEIGESLGEFTLVSEIGTGAAGRVYLARDRDLAGRMVVIKATPRIGGEHLNMARLQHTFIVPLFSVRDYPTNHLRLLCMPYLGGSSIDRINHQLRDLPFSEKTGNSLLNTLSALALPEDREGVRETPSLRFLRRASFTDSICWIGVCLAEALQYAHDQGLVHFDIKPSNILLTKDAQPMLLDFHLARYPISPGDKVENFGGTAAYMSPEQRKAFESIRATGKSIVSVGTSSDIYSLGLTLAECLKIIDPIKDFNDGELRWKHSNQLSPGLNDILKRALTHDPARRYRTASEFGDDLRRHISQLPLKGVRNRSIRERWTKWRRRRPQGRAVATLAALLLLGVLGMGVVYWNQQVQNFEQARSLRESSRQLADKGDFKSALETIRKAATVASRSFGGATLRREIEKEGVRILRVSKEHDLDEFVDKINISTATPLSPLNNRRILPFFASEAGRTFWMVENFRICPRRPRRPYSISPCCGPTFPRRANPILSLPKSAD
ncbi:serine/threonine protein kinase [bacterium]|nr:serine/threonine protein kinase [bacterium]